MFPQMQ